MRCHPLNASDWVGSRRVVWFRVYSIYTDRRQAAFIVAGVTKSKNIDGRAAARRCRLRYFRYFSESTNIAAPCTHRLTIVAHGYLATPL